MSIRHVTREEFEAYLQGRELPPEELERIESHAAVCRACAWLGEEVDGDLRATEEARGKNDSARLQ